MIGIFQNPLRRDQVCGVETFGEPIVIAGAGVASAGRPLIAQQRASLVAARNSMTGLRTRGPIERLPKTSSTASWFR